MAEKNIILIITDALRWDKLGIYGNKRELTPNIDKFASDGIIFTKCYSSSTWTFPAVGSLFTSYYPDVHLLKEVVRDEEGMITTDVLGPNFKTIASILAENGYNTLSIVANPWLRDFFQITRGFKKRIYEKKVEAKRINELLNENLSEVNPPFFIYLHYMDCHAPFKFRIKVREEYKKIFESLEFPLGYKYFKKNFENLDKKYIEFLNKVYEGEVKYLDYHLGEIFEKFKDSIIIFTSDHGEYLGDRKYHSIVRERIIAFGHNKTPYEELIRVPLIIKVPGTKSIAIDNYVHHVDIFPTILDLIGISPPENKIQGKSLIPLINGGKIDKHFDMAYSIKHESRYFNIVERSINFKDKKLIQFIEPEGKRLSPIGEESFIPINFSFENLFTLLGYKINKKKFNRGEYGWVKLYFKCNQKIDSENIFFMILFTDEKTFQVPFIEKHFPSGGLKRIKDWKEGEIIEDSFSFSIPANVKPGNYYLKFGAYNLNIKHKSEDAEEFFIGGAKIFGKIEVLNSNDTNKALKAIKNITKKILFYYAGYIASGNVLNKKEIYKRGDIVLSRVRMKALSKNLKHLHFKFFPDRGKIFNYPVIFQPEGGILTEKHSVYDTTIPIQIPPFLNNGKYKLKCAVFPKILRKKKWNFAYFFIEEICIKDEIDFVLNKNLILIGINIYNKLFKAGEEIKGEVILKIYSPINETFEFSIFLEDEMGSKVFGKNFTYSLNYTEIPYIGYILTSFKISIEIPLNLNSGEYILNFNHNGKNIKLYQLSILKDFPKQKILKEEFYILKENYGDKKEAPEKFSEKDKEYLRNLLNEKFKEGFLLRSEKMNNVSKKNFLDDKIESELKDLGYL